MSEFKFEIEERDISYENCSLNINKKVKYLQGDIEKAGFSKKNLKNTLLCKIMFFGV